MDIVLTPITIDILLVAFLLVMAILGYKRGFTLSLYNLLSTVLTIILSIVVSGPLSKMIVIYSIDSELLNSLGDTINRVIIFFGLLLLFKLLFFIMGLLIKPLIKDGLYKIDFIKKFDTILGLIVQLIEGLVIAYFILILIISPISSNGKNKIEDTIIANKIVHIIPDVYEEIDVFDTLSKNISMDSYDPTTLYTVSYSINKAYDAGFVSDEKLDEMVGKYYQELDNTNKTVTVSKKQYDEIKSLVNKLDNKKYNHQKILDKLKVSE